MDKKNEQTKNVFKQNILENASNFSYKLNPQIIKTSKQIRKISFLKNKRNALFPYDDEEIEINKDYVYEFLRKAPGARTFKDLQNVAEYLSKNYKYFSKIKKEEGTKKLENITKICRLEFFKKGSTIIKLGDIGEKFYIVMEGKVEIYKPKFIEINESPKNFLKLLQKIKDNDVDIEKYNRIKNKNAQIFNKLPLEINDNNIHKGFDIMELKQLFFYEIDEKMGEYGIDFTFGDIALIKRARRNATIKAKEDCCCLTITNMEYNRVIFEYQKKILGKEIESFIKTYSFFRHFTNDKMVKLFNCFTKIELFRGDFLYKQNMDANSIYILNNGSFIVYSCISFPWINDFINYIDYSDKNILQFLIKNSQIQIDELINTIQKFQQKNQTHLQDEEINEKWYKINEYQINDNLYTLKKDEEKLNSPDYLFRLNLKKVEYKDVLGLEEAFDFKKRFCNYKCISEKAELKEIKIIDLIRLILSMSKKEISDLLNIIKERKKLMKNQIEKSLKKLDKELIFKFDSRYENLAKSKDSGDEEKKSAVLLSSLKLKGYKTTIQDILDKKIKLFSNEKNKNPINILKKINKKNKSSEDLFNRYYKNRNKFNEVKYKKKKINIRLIKNYSDETIGLITNYQNRIINNINCSKPKENIFPSPINSNKMKRIQFMNLNSKSHSNYVYNENIKNIIFNEEGNKTSNYLNKDEKLESERKILPILKKIKSRNKSVIINSNHNFGNAKTIRKEYNEFYNIFNHFDKNFFVGDKFKKKFKDKYNLRYQIK